MMTMIEVGTSVAPKLTYITTSITTLTMMVDTRREGGITIRPVMPTIPVQSAASSITTITTITTMTSSGSACWVGAFSATDWESTNSVMPPNRTLRPRLPVPRRPRSMRVPPRSIRVCRNASIAPRLWSAAKRLRVMGPHACSRMGHGATVRPNRSLTEVSLGTSEF